MRYLFARESLAFPAKCLIKLASKLEKEYYLMHSLWAEEFSFPIKHGKLGEIRVMLMRTVCVCSIGEID